MVFHTEKSKQNFSWSRLGKIFPGLDQEKNFLYGNGQKLAFLVIFSYSGTMKKNFEQFYCPMEIIGTIRKMVFTGFVDGIPHLKI